MAETPLPSLLGALKAAGRFAWDVLIPRFITEDVALRYVGDDISADWGEWSAYEIVCCMDDIEPGEAFDAIAEVDAFQWLGIGFGYRMGNFRKWGSDPWGDA